VIVPMKVITVLCSSTDQERALRALRMLGVLHLNQADKPEGPTLEAAEKQSALLHRCLRLIPSGTGNFESVPDPEKVVAEIVELADRRRTLSRQVEAMDSERDRISPFGSLNAGKLNALLRAGLSVRLYRVPVREDVSGAEEVIFFEVNRDRKFKYIAAFGQGRVDGPAEDVTIPVHSPEQLSARISELKKEISDIEIRLRQCAACRELIEDLARQAEEQVQFERARCGMQTRESICYIKGYCPSDDAKRIKKVERENGWGVLIREPGPEDSVPTLIRNRKWIRLIEPVFSFMGITPGYREADISALFLIFFSVFFAMIVGDAGYGIVFLAGSLWGRRRFTNAPPTLFPMLTLMSICTLAWGILTGNYFGMTAETAALKGLHFEWFTRDENIMLFCFLLGAFHLTLAHGWNAFRMGRSLRALSQIGWICTTWTMYFAARSMILGQEFPPLGFVLLGVGIALILGFMIPRGKLKESLPELSVLPLNVIGNFVDVVSYIRLFAVGSATYAVAAAFNEMAVGIGFHGVVSTFLASLILLGGHTLNILLASMGVLVHGMRLNALEFSTHMGLYWTGHAYRPFACGDSKESNL